MVATEIHQSQCVFGVLHGAMEVLHSQPGHASLIVLHELAINFDAGFFVELEIWVLLLGVQQQMQQGIEPPRLGPIGPTGYFHLQNTQVQSQLDHIAAIASLNQSDADALRVERPLL
jgi:hypothetical protein